MIKTGLAGRRCVQSDAAGSIEDFGSKLLFRLFGAFLGARELRTDRPRKLSKWAAAGIRAAGFASSFDLRVRSHIGLRCLPVQLGSGNLPLVPLGESLVHRPTVHHPADPARTYRPPPRRSARPDRAWLHLDAAVEPGGFVSRIRSQDQLLPLEAGIFRAEEPLPEGGDPACQLNARRQKAPASEAGGWTAVRTWRRATISEFVPCSFRTNVARRAMQRHSAHSSVLWCRKIGMWLIPIC
jgi:hypothetical protein